jgi:hypothetical protein
VHYSHTRNLEVITLVREKRVDIICLPIHNSHKMQPLDKGLIWPPKTFYSQEIEIYLRWNLGSVCHHHLPNWQTIQQCIQANCNRWDSGQRLSGDRPVSLWQEHLQTTQFPSSPRGHRCCFCEPSLVKTSDRPSVSSANLSLVISAEALRTLI